MKRTIRSFLVVGAAAAVAAGTTAVVAAAQSGRGAGAASHTGAPSEEIVPAVAGANGSPSDPSRSTAAITALQDHLRATPADATGWATLGLDYVEQARTGADPAYYPKAEMVLQKSLDLGGSDNFTAFAGEAALASARHDFRSALGWATRGVAVNGYSAALWGALADAQTQLGMYDAAAASVQRMVDLRPGTPSLARASYVAELRGDIAGATEAMARALDAAGTPADKAFAHYYLGELALNAGRPADALPHFATGMREDPAYAPLYEGRARAEAALGRDAAAVADFAEAVGRVPQPAYVLEYADYLQSLGRTEEAHRQYEVFLAENQLFTSNGVQLDSDATLYYADRGDGEKALAIATAGIRSRPFLEMRDAYAWALHAAGRDAEALVQERAARATGVRNALFEFHLGVIEKALGHTANAVSSLRTALAINPHFHPLHAPVARRMLTELEGRS
jgi:tetratricopeptide (TPR) repeat protein